MSNLGDWIKSKWKTQAAFGERIGIAQGRVSKWVLGTEGITEDYQAKIRKLGYDGPWPREEAQETAAAAVPTSGLAEEIVKLKGRIEALEGQILAALVAAKSLDERMQRLERQ